MLPPEDLWNKPDPDFDFKKRDRSVLPARDYPWRLLNQHQSLNSFANSDRLISAAYRNAIEISCFYMQGTGVAAIGALAPVSWLVFTWYETLKGVDAVMLGFAIVETLIFGLLAAFTFALEFMPRPFVLLNRRDRTVSFQRIKLPRFFLPWKAVDRPFMTYPWDTAKARVYRVCGRSAEHSLWLVWGNDPDNPRQFKDAVRLGYIYPSEWSCLDLWEHVRRFMEEGGPHFSAGHEVLGGPTRSRATPPFPDTILAAAGPSLARLESAAFARWSPK